jgi:hypothetical protein
MPVSSYDLLVHGAGDVAVTVKSADLQFLEKVELVPGPAVSS